MFKTIKSRLIGTSVVIVVFAIAVATLVSYQLAKSFILDDINVSLGETGRCPDRSCRFESVVMNIMLPS